MERRTHPAISWTRVVRAALAGGLAATMAGAFMPAYPDMEGTSAPVVQLAQADEQDVVTVSDNITENTTWESGKTYKLSKDIAVKYDVTLTIEPGAKVVGAGEQGIIVYGSLVADGVEFSNVGILSGNASGRLYSISLTGCAFSGKGEIDFSDDSSSILLRKNTFKDDLVRLEGENHGAMTIEDNSFRILYYRITQRRNMQQVFNNNVVCSRPSKWSDEYSHFTLQVESESTSCSGNAFCGCVSQIYGDNVPAVVGNVFHGGDFSVDCGGDVNIRGNSFLDCPVEASPWDEQTTYSISGNDFFGTGVALQLESDDGEVVATGNWFGTTDEAAISRRISDARSNFKLTKTIQVSDSASARVTQLAEPKHKMGDWVVEQEPAVGKAGLEQRTCAECGYAEEREIPALKMMTITDDMVSGIVDRQYTGEELGQRDLEVRDGDKVLERGDADSSWGDYYVTYSNNVEPGTATVTVTGRGSYEGSVTKSFNISKRDIADCEPFARDETYDGTAKTPKIDFEDLDIKAPVLGTDYDVTYSNNVEIGTASYTITAKGSRFSGLYTGSFKIVPEGEYLQKQISELEAQIAALKSDTARSSCSCDFSSVNSTLSSLSKNLSDLQESVKSLEGSSAPASRVADIEKSVQSISDGLERLSGNVEKLEKDSASKAEVSSIGDELANMQEQLQATTAVTQAAPAKLSLKAGRRGFRATWKSPKGLSQYGTVKWQYRYRVSDGSWKGWKQTKSRKASVRKLKRGKTYDFEVRAKVTLKAGGTKLVSAVAERAVKVK